MPPQPEGTPKTNIDQALERSQRASQIPGQLHTLYNSPERQDIRDALAKIALDEWHNDQEGNSLKGSGY